MKHAVLIQEALNGKRIQFRKSPLCKWQLAENTRHAVALMAGEYNGWEFMVYTPPPPDKVCYMGVYRFEGSSFPNGGYFTSGVWDSSLHVNKTREASGIEGELVSILKLTIDGVTGKVKSSEVVQ